MLLIDENIENEILIALNEINAEYVLVRNIMRMATDLEIILKSIELKATILTKDKDFGEWFFSHGEKGVGVIFLRFKKEERSDSIDSLKYLLVDGTLTTEGKFITVKAKRIRTRKL